MKTIARSLLLSYAAVLLCVFSHAQNKRKIDSLAALLDTKLSDTSRANTYNLLASNYRFIDQGRTRGYAEKAIAISKQAGFLTGIANGYNLCAQAYENEGRYEKALAYYDSAVATWKQSGAAGPLAKMYLNIANVYNKKGELAPAAEYALQSLRIQDSLHDKFGEAVCKLTLGNIYYGQGNSKDALLQYEEALRLNRESAKNPEFESTAVSNIGSMFEENGRHDSALYYFRRSLENFIALNMESRYCVGYNNIAGVFSAQENYDSARYYLQQALFYGKKTNRPEGLITSYVMMGNINDEENRPDSAIYFYREALAIAVRIGARDNEAHIYSLLSKIYEKKGEFETALHFLRRFNALDDSLHGSKQTNTIEALKKNYELDKKDQEVKIANAESKAADERNNRNLVLFIAASLVGLLITGFLFGLYRTKRRHNVELALKNDQISQQKEEITSSINYAKKIQEAILPLKEEIREALPESFVLWMPRDIVSGDFYWFVAKNNRCYIACVDCTGHGVPGAFMSMIGNTLLNEIVLERNIQQPGQILDMLHLRIRQALKQEMQTGARDGMDISFCVIDLDKMQLEYAGANRPVWLISNGQLRELVPDKQPIGGDQEERRKPFTQQTCALLPGDCLYLFSDGYPDQFGGEKGKKLMTRRFQDLLLSLSSKEMVKQQQELEAHFSEWKKGHEQVDDVLVIGVRLI
jgi:serine phosphatase RsbU (regulator of sigma subunit)